MNIFNLPDLGEGLPDAEIQEWFVKEGDTVTLDQPLVAMETAKAVVEVPSPQTGIINKLHGKPGEIIKTGTPLVSFVSETIKKVDKGTVVGNLEESQEVSEDNFIIGHDPSTSARVKATPAIRLMAKKLGIALSEIQGSGEHGLITEADLKHFKAQTQPPALAEGYEPLRGVRRAMLNSMIQSHKEVVPVSIFDEAIIKWHGKADITVRLIQAIINACEVEPHLNAWFDTTHSALRCFKEIHLGLAMDTNDGLFVPVIHNAHEKSPQELRTIIDNYKVDVGERNIPADNLKGATITLSNFGKFSGRFASPIIVPPMVAILAVGRIYQKPVVDNNQITIQWVLPLSLSFDHRAATGGEATRFLGVILNSLQTS